MRVDVDHYGVLGVARGATAREIRRAYRRLARRHHPDLNGGDGGSRRFAELAEAYEVLNDPFRRARYDRTLTPPIPLTPAHSRVRTPGPAPPDDRWTDRRGILELSPCEVDHLARSALTLRDAEGQTLVLPAGLGHGDTIAVSHGGRRALLTVLVQEKT
jgi:hypothetical protein